MTALRRLAALALLVALSGCGRDSSGEREKPAGPQESMPPARPGLELQQEDYAVARGKFRTKLLRKGPAPQRWKPVTPPPGVSEIVYRSGDLRLKAWINRPADAARKHPAVLFLHGGWAFGEDDWEQAQPFRDAGFVVMTPLLRGENGLPGVFTMFYDEIDDVLAAAEYLAALSYVDPKRVYVAGHSAGGTHTMLAAMASSRFHAAASLSGSPDRLSFVEAGYQKVTPFDRSDIQEFRVRSPVTYATSFKCPARLYYGSKEGFFDAETRRTALLAKQKGLDVEAVVVPGDHFSSVPEALRQAIAFFKGK